jgi:hypothetical protein
VQRKKFYTLVLQKCLTRSVLSEAKPVFTSLIFRYMKQSWFLLHLASDLSFIPYLLILK